ncbi:MAG TPA: acyloxyacyl hydrolase [Stellaceae bacterium]|nr:acyloxyacyl hydrolase [Stellaceae bacterium]
MNNRLGGIRAAVGLLLLLASAAAARADDGDLLTIGGGAYNVLHNKKEAQLRTEYRFGYRFLYIIRPIAGVLATNKGSFYGYGGFRLDAQIGEHFVITPELAVGGWSQGGGKDLGGTLEFKSGGEFAYRFSDNSRLGFLFDHISNAGIYKKNPGVESAMLMYSIPIDWFSGP